VMMLMTARRDIMGDFTLPLYLKLLGWLTALVMFAATLGLFIA
jgi:Mn2+/Fe2+ NRAMP family transporter